MKRLFTFIGLSLFLVQVAAAAHEQALLARVTVYWAGEGSGERASSNGARLHEGNCAVDPQKIPFGSNVIFDDAACVAVDTGTDVVNRKAARECARDVREQNALVIDCFFETKARAMAWAAHHRQFVNVWVLPPEAKRKKRNQVVLELDLTKGASQQFSLASSRNHG